MTAPRTGSPEPFLKRSARATSNSRPISGAPSSMTHALAVVPPMSNESSLRSPRSRAAWAAAKAPAAGPDSTRRIGRGRATGGQGDPPGHFDEVAWAGNLRPRDPPREVLDVARHQGRHVHVRGRGRGALVLANL